MKIRKNECMFPSYKQLKQQIIKKEVEKYEKKINHLSSKINTLIVHNNFDSDHRQIKQSIINISKEKVLKQDVEGYKQNIREQKQPRKFSKNMNESLNYYLEDDKQQQNNFETYLRFKKKALQRDLFEQKPQKLTCDQKKKQKQEEQNLFKNLYFSKSKPPERYQSSNKIDKTQVNSSLKQDKLYSLIKNIQLFGKNSQRKKNKKCFGSSSSIKQQIKLNGQEKQMQNFQKNKKYLTENYLEILKKIGHTNIVKWRILND